MTPPNPPTRSRKSNTTAPDPNEPKETNVAPRNIADFDEVNVRKSSEYLGKGHYRLSLENLKGFDNKDSIYTFVAEMEVLEVFSDADQSDHRKGDRVSIVVTMKVGGQIFAKVTKTVLGGFLQMDPNEITHAMFNEIIVEPDDLIGHEATCKVRERVTQNGKNVTDYEFSID